MNQRHQSGFVPGHQDAYGFWSDLRQAARDLPDVDASIGGDVSATQMHRRSALGILAASAALASVGRLLKLTGLPFFGHPLLKVSAFRGVTSDGFFLFVDARDEQFDLCKTRLALNALGGLQPQPVEA